MTYSLLQNTEFIHMDPWRIRSLLPHRSDFLICKDHSETEGFGHGSLQLDLD